MHQQFHQPRLTFKDKFNMVAGVILPAIAITVEASTQLCASVFLDPIPTVWHLMLVILVPLAQLHVWFAIRRGTGLMLAGVVNAVAIGVSLFYSICYLPLLPVGILTLVILVGVLLLAPFLSLIAAISMRQQLRQVAAITPSKNFAVRTSGLLVTMGFTLCVIALIELPATLTRYGLQLAASPSAQTRTRGIRFLRTYGSKDHLLRSCYNQGRSTTGILGGLLAIQSPVGVDEARKIYYRVTGETFDMSAPPRRVAGHSTPQPANDLSDSRMGSKSSALSLADSRLEGTIDSDGGLAYLEWILTFENNSAWGKEARAEIQLPPGGVVTRVTLSDDRAGDIEAEFGNRTRVGEESQGRYTRDPVLVTTAGRDRILVQGFPVNAFDEETKIRLGITVPLVLESRSQVRLLLPHFEARNFRIPHYVNHKIWFESERPIATEFGGLYYGQMPDNDFMLGGAITDDDLSNPERSLVISRLDRDAGTWSRNQFELPGYIVKQWIEERTPFHLRRIVLVVDTSASMAEWEPQINAALGVLHRETDIKLVFADSEWLHESEHKDFVVSGLDEVSSQLASATFTGGADNAPALRKAWDLAAEAPGNNAIIWIHSPQLVTLDSIDKVRKPWQIRPYGPLLYSVQTTKGSDEIAKRLDGINEVKSVVRTGTLRADLERLFKQLSGQAKTFEFVRSVKLSETPEETEGYKTSDLLAKLWAYDEVVRLLNVRDGASNETAGRLAMRYQLVTPVTDAAVRDSTTESRMIDTGAVRNTFTSSRIFEGETLLLAAVLLAIALVAMKASSAGGGNFTAP